MEKDDAKIPWPAVDAQLKRIKRRAPWLAEELGVEKNAIYNWPKRGGVPMAYLPKLVSLFDISSDELLEAAAAKSPKRSQNSALSDEARELIQCVVRLDAMGDLDRKTFVLHAALLELAKKAFVTHDLSAERDLLERAEAEAESLRFRDPLREGADAGNKRRRG
jgi:hypothetical protein